ncbi:MAG: hypothetical protein JSR48_08900 [Verrucomicrobia bacterium]|nr:hypothetical protein [Verrucomicrobiota bacterium]
MRLRPLALAVVGFLAAVPGSQAQAPDTLADQVLTYDVYSPMADHMSTVGSTWYRADGTCVDLSRTWYRGSGTGRSLIGPGPTRSGYPYLYIKDSSNTARLLFRQDDGSYSVGEVLLFTDAVSGTMTDPAGSAMGYGAFRLRSSQFGTGPLNLSTRTWVSTAGATIAGFVIPGPSARFVLVRAIGPTLAKYGLTNTAAQLQLSLYDSTGEPITTVDWTAASNLVATFNQLFALCGAFPLNSGDGDRCVLVELPPGVYSANMTATVPGNGLVEIYFLP